MSLVDDIEAYKVLVDQRITNKTLPGSITLADEANCHKDLANLLLRVIGNLVTPFSFPISGDSPVNITTWASDYFATYGNGTFKVRLKNDDGSLQDRTDIEVARSINRTNPNNLIQTGITLDTTGFPDGDIIFYYSNEPLI